MARPHKTGEETRDFTIRVRVTPAEKKRLKTSADEQGLTVSDFMRLNSLSTAPLFKRATPERAEFIMTLAQLGKIGSNVNQIARALNQRQGASVPYPVLDDALRSIDTVTRHLITLLTHGH